MEWIIQKNLRNLVLALVLRIWKVDMKKQLRIHQEAAGPLPIPTRTEVLVNIMGNQNNILY